MLNPIANPQIQSPQTDPLGSPHPVPWSWVQQIQAEATRQNKPITRLYRSQALHSPDGKYAAYSRIQMQAFPNFVLSRISSVLFLEQLETGQIQTITATSPLADNFFTAPDAPQSPGTVSILMPVSWSVTCDRLLCREFESRFGTSMASDYAVVWDSQVNRAYTIAPQPVQQTQAILMGWSQDTSDRVLFRVGNMGDSQWPLWAVSATGETIAAPEDKPTVYGQGINSSWAGAHIR